MNDILNEKPPEAAARVTPIETVERAIRQKARVRVRSNKEIGIPNLGESWMFEVNRWLWGRKIKAMLLSIASVLAISGIGILIGQRAAAALALVVGLTAATLAGPSLQREQRERTGPARHPPLRTRAIVVALPDLAIVGGIYLVAQIGISILAQHIRLWLPQPTAQPDEMRMMLALTLILLPVTVPAIMAVWFAPGLCLISGIGALRAIALSFQANLKNLRPMMQWGRYYSYIITATLVVATLLTILGMLPAEYFLPALLVVIPLYLVLFYFLLLLPLVACLSSYVMLRDLFEIIPAERTLPVEPSHESPNAASS